MGGKSDAGESSCEDAKSESETLEIKSTGPYKCNYEGCNATFPRPSRLKWHMCRHTGERPFKCDRPNCGRAYTHHCHLKRHIASNHQESLFQKKLKCTYPGCHLSLHNEANLRRHYRRAHERSYNCKECGKSFAKNHHLRAHMISHSETSSFKCPECDLGFSTEALLKKHQHCHKKHACSARDCKEVFQKWTQLRRHLKIAHPAEFCCDICGKKFKTKGNLIHHVKTHLPDRPSFPCPYPDCSRSYVLKFSLSSHIKWFHEGKGVKCTYEGCGRMICTKARWMKHMAWHEKDHSSPAKPASGKARKPRSDKGIPRRSMAATLAGMPPLPLPLEKKIISGDALDTDEDVAVKGLGKLASFSIVCEPGTSSDETEKNAISTQRVLPFCSL